MKWDYLVVELSNNIKLQRETLEKLGLEGWDMIGPPTATSNWVAYFKKARG